jgi:hypothetical protein
MKNLIRTPKPRHMFYVACALVGAAAAAGLAPTADTLGKPSATTEAGAAKASSDGATVALVAFAPPEAWVSGGPTAEPENRPCPTAAVSAYEQVRASRETFTSTSGAEALVHVGYGDESADVVVKAILAEAAMCAPWQVGNQQAEVTNVQPLAGFDGVDLTYQAGTTTARSAWMASGHNLIGVTAICSDAEWAQLLKAAADALGVKAGS